MTASTCSSSEPARPARRWRPVWRSPARRSCLPRAPTTPGRRHAPSTPARASSRSWSESACHPRPGARTPCACAGMELAAGGRAARIGYADREGPRSAWGVDRRTFDACWRAMRSRAGPTCARAPASCACRPMAGASPAACCAPPAGRGRASPAGLVIGADGVRSTVARQAGVERQVRFPRRLGLVAHYAAIDALTDHGEMHVGRGYYVGLAPTPGGELNVGMALPMGGRATASERFDAAIAGLPAVAEHLRASRRLTADPRRGPNRAPRWRRRRPRMDARRRRGRVRRPIHRRGHPPRAPLGASRHRCDPRRRRLGRGYRVERRRAFAAKTALSWLVQGFLAVPPLLEHAVGAPRRTAGGRAAPRIGARRLRAGDRRALAACAARGARAVRSELHLVMHAPFDRIFDLAAEVERWPEHPPALPVRAPRAHRERRATLRDGRPSRRRSRCAGRRSRRPSATSGASSSCTPAA